MEVLFSDGSRGTCASVKAYGRDDFGRERVRPLHSTPGGEVHNLVQAKRRADPTLSYAEAMRCILNDPRHATLAKRFAESSLPDFMKSAARVRKLDYSIADDLHDEFRDKFRKTENESMADEIAGLADRWRKLTGSTRKFTAAGELVHAMVMAKRREDSLNYSDALKAVLADPNNAELKVAFSREV
jgi:hypothetical protein